MGAVTLRKDLSKPGLMKVLRHCFEGVADPMEGRRYSIADCLMSGLAVFPERIFALYRYRKERWDQLRSLFRAVPFPDWGALYACALQSAYRRLLTPPDPAALPMPPVPFLLLWPAISDS